MNDSLPSINLTELAKQSMLERGLLPEFSPNALKEADRISPPLLPQIDSIKDMRDRLWFSIDNENSRDLDQLTLAEESNKNPFKIYVAIANVALVVKNGSAIDHHALHNTTSVYTPTKVFSMLPERLSTDLTSLNENQERCAVVVEIDIDEQGQLKHHQIYYALVKNKAKLAYPSVGSWLEEGAPILDKISYLEGLAEQIKLQDKIAQLLRKNRYKEGALNLETIEITPIVQEERVIEIKSIIPNRARELIEDFMIAANTAVADDLRHRHIPFLIRVVRTPKRWDRIRDIAHRYGEKLPPEPDSKALDSFLLKRRAADPASFPDLSLTMIKLLGNGEYIVNDPDCLPVGHFSLAIRNYTHSTAPNRRYSDLIIQRMLQALLIQESIPYSCQELEELAHRCTQKEDDANKVERKMKKSAAILYLYPFLQHTFEAIVTGASYKGTWVRTYNPPIEGKLVEGYSGLDVGDRIEVKLIHLDIEKGFIDFARSNKFNAETESRRDAKGMISH